MPRIADFRFRQIHLDFHTGPWIDDVGVDFDAREFARTMKRAHVNSVTVFAKCHHGQLYYNTKRPERHPGLRKNHDLLREQIDALHREGIRAPIYISVMCDEYAANQHKDWVALQPDGKRVGRAPLSNASGWQILDMSSPYQEYLAEQTREVLAKFKPVDGIFFDMCWDQPSVSKWAIEVMKRENLNPQSEEDRKTYAHLVALRYMMRFKQMVLDVTRGATVFFNSRPISNLREEMDYYTQTEIESLATGGWGYMYFPTNVRFARNFPLPYMGMTARFHKSWADFGGIKPYAALEYETSQAIAHGARCSIGDQLHPRGTLEPAAYDLIGKAYARVEEREPWLKDATALTQIAVLQPDRQPVAQDERFGAPRVEEGAVRMLTQLKHQFDLIDRPADFDRYELIILPDFVDVDATLAKKIRAYIRQGGAILATGMSGLSSDAKQVLLPELGIKAHGNSPFTTTYIRFGDLIQHDVPPMDHVMYEMGARVTPAAGAQALARVVEPYFERTWEHFSSHFQTPPAKLSRYAAAVQKGRCAYIAHPIFSAFATHGNVPFRLLVRNVLERLLSSPLLRVQGPVGMEATITRQRGRTIVHLLQYSAECRTEKLDLIEDVVPVLDVPISLRMERAPRRVYLAPERAAVSFEHLAGHVNLSVPVVNGHAMIVFE